MAKKKAASKTEKKEVAANNDILLKELSKKYGSESIISADTIVSKPQQIIPISPQLDLGLNGGIPEGSWIILSGPPKAGKSSLALWIASICQRPEYGGRHVYYLDAEGRLKKMNLMGTKGLDLNKITVIQSSEGNIIPAEKFADAGRDIIKGDPGCVLIVDSASAMCSAKELAEDSSGQIRSLGPKIMANFCRTMGTVVPVQRTIVIMIQHLIANTSGYGPAQYEDGGRKIQYQADIKLRCKGFQAWMIGDKQIGQNVTWDVVTSALGPPGAKVENKLRYNEGIDVEWEIIDLACEFSIIKKAGAWFSLEYNGEEYKAQGQAKMRDHLLEHPDQLEFIKNELKAIME